MPIDSAQIICISIVSTSYFIHVTYFIVYYYIFQFIKSMSSSFALILQPTETDISGFRVYSHTNCSVIILTHLLVILMAHYFDIPLLSREL